MALESLNKITLDVSTPLNIPVVRAVQEDIRSRYVEITLVSNGEPLVLPAGVTAIVGLRRANDTYVLYDTDEDNNPAVTFDGNKATVYLRQEAVAMAGSMYTTVTLFNGTNKKLSAFAFTLKVDQTAVPSNVVVDHDYINIFQQEMDDIYALLHDLSATATTLPAGSSATVSYNDGVFSFGIPKGDPGDLSRADLETKAPVITDTSSGSIASTIDCAGGMWAKSLVVNIEPIQAGSGDPSPDNVRPISGRTGLTVARTGKNICPPDIEQGAFDGNGINTAPTDATYPTRVRTHGYIRVDSGSTITVSAVGDAAYFTVSGYAVNDYATPRIQSTSWIALGGSCAINADVKYIRIAFRKADSSANINPSEISDVMCEYGSTASAYEPYAGTSYPVSWQDEAGTVYGGTLDVVSGLLTVDRAMVDLGTLNWTYVISDTVFYTSIANKKDGLAGLMCSRYRTVGNSGYSVPDYAIGTSGNSVLLKRVFVSDPNYNTAADFKSAMSGVQLVYELATPQTYQLTPTEVAMLLGVNNIFSDGGSVSVEYPCDTKLYIERLTQPTDEDMIANANIPAHQYFMVGNSLYYSTAAIAQGADIVVGTNCTRLSLADALNALNS